MTAAMTDRLIRLDDVRDIPSAEPTPPHSWQPANLLHLAANPPEPPTIGGLLYPGKRTVLSGETESMKTWLALILCKAELDIQLPVIWVDLDAMGPGAMLERLQLLGVTDQQLDHFHYIQPAEMLDPQKMGDLVELIRTAGSRLCVIDAFNPILSLHDLEPNSTPDIETFWRTIADPIAHAGAAPVLLDHVVKNAETRGKYSYGSERKASGAIVHIGFRLLHPLTKGGQGKSLLTVHKDRPGYLPRPTLGRLVITANGSEMQYRIEPDKSHDGTEFRPTVLMEKVSDYLQRYGQPASRNTIEQDVTGKRDAIRTALTVLVEEGYIDRQDGPRRSQLFTHLKPYSEAGDTPASDFAPTSPHFAPELRSSTAFDFAPHRPLWGRGAKSSGEPAQKQGRTQGEVGEVIPEYEHPLPDDSLIPYDLEPGE